MPKRPNQATEEMATQVSNISREKLLRLVNGSRHRASYAVGATKRPFSNSLVPHSCRIVRPSQHARAKLRAPLIAHRSRSSCTGPVHCQQVGSHLRPCDGTQLLNKSCEWPQHKLPSKQGVMCHESEAEVLPTNSEKQRIKRRMRLAALLQRPDPASANTLRPIGAPVSPPSSAASSFVAFPNSLEAFFFDSYLLCPWTEHTD